MSLEQAIAENTEAVKALTAALAANNGASAKSAPAEESKGETTTTRGRGRPSNKSKSETEQAGLTVEQVKAKAVQVKDKLGKDKAKELIGRYAPELAKIKPDDFEAFVTDCDKALNGEDEDGDDDDSL